jgi:hypothetical protein
MPLSPGQILNNRYRIVKILGQGGFGAVYRAWDTTFDLPIALKENTETSPEAQRQFLWVFRRRGLYQCFNQLGYSDQRYHQWQFGHLRRRWDLSITRSCDSDECNDFG